MQVTRDGENDGVDVGAVEVRGSSNISGRLPCAFSTIPWPRRRCLGSASATAMTCVPGSSRTPEQGRAAIADADHSQSHRREIGIGSLADCSLGKARLAAAEQPRKRRRFRAKGGMDAETSGNRDGPWRAPSRQGQVIFTQYTVSGRGSTASPPEANLGMGKSRPFPRSVA